VMKVLSPVKQDANELNKSDYLSSQKHHARVAADHISAGWEEAKG